MTTLQIPLVQVGTSRGAVVEVEIPNELKIHGSTERPFGHGMFRIMTAKDGDQRVVWNNQSLLEIREAKRMFDSLVEKGLVPYKVSVSGKKSPEVMKEFDAAAEEIIFSPVALAVGG